MNKTFLSEIISNNSMPIVILSQTGTFEYINSGFSKIFGFKKEEILGEKFTKLLPKFSHKKASFLFKDMIIKYNNTKQYKNILQKDKNGREILVDMNLSCLNIGKEKFILAVSSETKKFIRNNTDFLTNYFDKETGYPTREFAKRWVTKVVDSKYFSFLTIKFCKISHLNKHIGRNLENKLFNLFYSEVLKIFVDEKIELFRFSDMKMGVLLHNQTNEKNLKSFAKKILKNRYFKTGTHNVLMNLTVGISKYENNNIDKTKVIFNSEIASEEAKENEYKIYSKDMDEKLKLLNLLESAYRNNEFIMYFQPYVDMKNNKIIGMESLSRWKNKNGKIISPDKFIPLIEENNLIELFEERVIDLVFNQVKKWEMKYSLNIPISINLSPKQFTSEKTPIIIKKLLKNYSINPQHICFEITETSLLENLKTAIKNINSLKKMGFTLSLDDFGTGYSSLSYLRDLNIDVLKIDKSFIDDIVIDEYERKILKSISSLGKSLNLKIIFEGIETREQLEIIKGISNEYYQGYYFSKPLPVYEVEKKFFEK